MKKGQMIEKKSWEEFRNTGLLLFINSILHAFGWAIVVEIENEDDEVTKVYPARVKFRGFDEQSQEESYRRIGRYLKNNANEIAKEAES